MTVFSAGEFLQGFLLEAGDHLNNITRILLALEQPAEEVERHELYNDLFRACHTMKGLCGMVGLQDGAQLSHAMETVIQALLKVELSLNAQVIDVLLTGASSMAAIVEAVRTAGEAGPELSNMPNIRPVLGRLEELLQPAGEQALPAITEGQDQALDNSIRRTLAAYPDLYKAIGALERHKIRQAAQSGQMFAVVLFTPSNERTSAGENVDRLRQQLTQAGTVIKAVPVMAEGKISFQFLVSAPQPLEKDRLTADEVVPLLMNEQRQPLFSEAPVVSPARSTAVRVELDRLDDLMRFAGDLIMQRAHLVNLLSRFEGLSPADRREMALVHEQMGRKLRDMRRAILRARMVPLSEVFQHMPLVVRDLARASQKEVQLVITGETTEVDKMLVERLLDPLIHLVRNAITHGIETHEERVAAGKPPRGTLTLRGLPSGDHILIEVSDDGRGVDLQRVAKKAAALGWIEDGVSISPDEALDFIARPGFSTQPGADMAAGRGVGLDVVTRMVSTFGGHLRLVTSPGQGSTFRLRLPLTLMIQDVLLVKDGEERYAVPRDTIQRVIEIDADRVVQIESGELLPEQEGFSVLYRLADFAERVHPAATAGRVYGLVSTVANGSNDIEQAETVRPVLVVEEILSMREVVVQPLSDPLVSQPGISGVTELGDGRIVLVLDLPRLLMRGKRRVH